MSKLHIHSRSFFSRIAWNLSIFSITAARVYAVDTALPWEEYKHQTISTSSTLDGWCSEEKAQKIMELVREIQPTTVVELGVYGGRSFLPAVATMEYLAKSDVQYGKKALAFAIDPWRKEPAIANVSEEHRSWWSSVGFTDVLTRFVKKMQGEGLDGRYRLLSLSSQEACTLMKIPAKSVDFLHIDANHSEEDSLADVQSWLPKVKTGGYIVLNDPHWPTMEKATNYLREHCSLHPSSSQTDSYYVFVKN